VKPWQPAWVVIAQPVEPAKLSPDASVSCACMNGRRLSPDRQYLLAMSDPEPFTLEQSYDADLGTLELRILETEDGSDLQALCERCHDYFELVTGRPVGDAAAQSLFSGLPPGKTYNDKFLLGLFCDSALVGVIDLIRAWRTETSWTLGLLMLDPDIRGRGVGKAVVRTLEAWIRSQGANVMRIGVVERNTRAISFWKRLGYIEIARSASEYGLMLTLTMERLIEE
jgi:GNAT superfamily N-acetyltransferase